MAEIKTQDMPAATFENYGSLIAAVEEEVGHSHGAWDLVTPEELVRAVLLKAPESLRTTSQPVGVPEGWKLVPIEPPAEMTWAATVTADREWCYHVGRDDAKKLWAAMLAASPAIIATAPSAAVITDAQITAGAAVLDAKGKPIGRNVAIDVFEAMCAATALTASPTPPAARGVTQDDYDKLSADLTRAKRMLVDLHKHGNQRVRDIIEARTGSWFAWGQNRDATPTAAGDEACQHCNGSGEVFTHAEDCADDLCALNGDAHSCQGQVLACACKAAEAGKVGG